MKKGSRIFVLRSTEQTVPYQTEQKIVCVDLTKGGGELHVEGGQLSADLIR